MTICWKAEVYKKGTVQKRYSNIYFTDMERGAGAIY